MRRPLVCCDGANRLTARCQKNPSLQGGHGGSRSKEAITRGAAGKSALEKPVVDCAGITPLAPSQGGVFVTRHD